MRRVSLACLLLTFVPGLPPAQAQVVNAVPPRPTSAVPVVPAGDRRVDAPRAAERRVEPRRPVLERRTAARPRRTVFAARPRVRSPWTEVYRDARTGRPVSGTWIDAHGIR